LWRAAPVRRPVLLGAVSYVLFVAAAWGLSQIFSGRAAFILLGTILGSLLMANVWLRILPALREMGEAQAADRPADAAICARAQERSVHNSYLIFPTVVLMLSNHYPVIYGHRFAWIVIALLLAAFVGLRHVVVSGKAGVWTLVPVTALGITAFVISALPPPGEAAGGRGVSFATARGIIIQRCLNCHSTVPADRTFGPVPGGIAFDRPEDIKRHAARIKVRAVDSLTMPNRHESGMTAAERKLLGRWVNEGAQLQ
jgi:uncharacterized membrane protein